MNEPGVNELVAGRYRLVRLIGEGSAARVYEAVDTQRGKPVALKVLRGRASLVSSAIERFEREMTLLRSLQSDAFIELYDVVRDRDNQPAFVMELMQGTTLEDRLQSGPLSAEQVIELGIRVASGLELAHAKGIVHGDLKPSNIYIQDGRFAQAKIGDLGLAERTDDEGKTMTGTVLGTPYYMSPEAAQGLSRSPHSDTWSLGIVLYECAYGRRPFDALSVLEVLRNVLTVEPELPPLPYGLHRVLAQALAKNPEQRFASGRALAQALSGLRKEPDVRVGPLDAPLPVPREAAQAKRSQRPLVLAIMALFAALLGAFVFIPRLISSGVPATVQAHRPNAANSVFLIQALLVGVSAAIVARLLIAVVERKTAGGTATLAVAQHSVAKVRTSDILTQSIALTMDSLILQSSGDPRVDLRRASLAIAIDELQQAKTLGDRRAALDRAIEIADKVHEQLAHKPWWIQHKDGIALLTAFAGATTALISKIIEVAK